MVLVIVTFLQFRGFDVGSLGGFFRLGFVRTLSTGAILLFFAYPLILLSDTITQRLFGGGSSKQNIVEFFSGSRTIEQRMMIIVFAVAIAPVVEEFLFRFFIYGVYQALFRAPSGRHIQRAAVRRGARPLTLVCAIVCFGKLFRDCIRVERFHSGRHDDAFALQCVNSHRPRISGDLFSMSLRKAGAKGADLSIALGQRRGLKLTWRHWR